MSIERRWRNAILDSNATVEQAIENLNNFSLQIVLIVSDNGALEGTVCDGDLRRGLLRGLTMQSSIGEVVNRNPLVVPRDLGIDMIKRIMSANNIRQIPIVDERNSLVGLHLWDLILKPEERLNTMIVMAGGQGKRLRPYTEDCPKPMLHVAGKPMLEHILLKGIEEGFSSFIISVGYLGHMIQEYFENGHKLGVNIEYIEESEPLGTAGSLSLVERAFELPIVVTNGDVISNICYQKILNFHTQNQACATMAVYAHEWQNPYGVVQMNGIDIVGFEEKPVVSSHINAGVYGLSSCALQYLKKNSYCDMPTLFERLKNDKQRIVAYPMHEDWIDVGRPGDLLKANEDNGISEATRLRDVA